MLTICTFNIKNNYRDYQSDKADKIIKFINQNKIDYLCLQEVFTKCRRDLQKNLRGTKYKIYGKYRFSLPIFTPINEAVSIITKEKVLYNRTYHLPFLPSGLKRVVTKVVTKTDDLGYVTILNTHLDYMFDFVKKRQLKKIIKLIETEKNPVILTGDFNLKINNPIFKEFIKKLNNLGLKRVDIHEKTLKQSRYNRSIDHIFIPDDYDVELLEVIKDLDISDHYPVLLKVSKK